MVTIAEAPAEEPAQDHQEYGADQYPEADSPDRHQVPDGGQDALVYHVSHEPEERSWQERREDGEEPGE
jgi:hypothetical protein